MADKKYSVILEKVGNQPLMTTKILCGELGLGLAKAKGMVDKVPSTIATDLESAKALELKKKLEEAGNTVSIPGLKIEAEPTAKKNVKSSAVSSDDAFAAIFGGSTTPKTTTVKKQSTSGATPKTNASKNTASANDSFDDIFGCATTPTATAKESGATKAEPKKTTSKAPAASSDSFDSLFGTTTPKKETKTQPKASVAKTMRKEYSNGSYEGEMKDGEPHGFGTYRWNDGDVYTGEYVNGVRHGKGKFVFASGNYYDGEWANEKYHGHGIYHWSDGDEFEGEWKNGKRHGEGKWTYADGRYYTGVWENGESISSSAIVYPSDSEAQGGTVKTKFERFEYDGGDVYEGETVNGLRHGKGKYTWASGTVYEGDWVKGKRCGFGITKSYRRKRHDGTLFVEYSYEGEWKDSKKNGHGVWKFSQEYADGIIKVYQSYDGEWVNDKKHGHGKFSVLTHVEEGEYIEGNAHGMFICYEADSASGKKYISWYDHGEKLVFLVPYDSSIKTLEDAKRAKAAEDAKNGRTVKAPPIKKVSSPVSTKEEVLDCSNKAMQAYNNRDYFRCLYYMNRGGLSGDVFYRDVIGMCYHKGYAYVENILTAKNLKYISDEEINICAFVLDKFVPKGTKNSKTYRAWCYYRLGDVQKAAGMITTRGLMFYDGRIQDINEIMCGTPLSKITPYSDEIMACNLVCKVMSALDGKTNWVNYLRQHYKEKVLIADAYIKFAKKERWQYEVAEIEEDIITFKSML